MKKRLLFLAILWLSAYSFGAVYYVKNGGSDSASGLSDALAWATISKVNGFTFALGDTVSFKCGSTWTEQLTIPRSGDATHQQIFNAYDTGAKPIIDGGLTRNKCVYSDGKNYYTIDGLELDNALNDGTGGGSSGACIEIRSGTGIIVQNCSMYHPRSRAIFTGACSNLTIYNNFIDTTPTSAPNDGYEIDGIYMQNGDGGHLITHNTILGKGDATQYYFDGIQTYNEDGFTIAYNFLANPTGYSSAQGNMLIQLEHGTGTFDVHHNILFNDTNVHGIIPIDPIHGSGTYNFYNNTIINLAGGASYCVTLKETPVALNFVNNILYTDNSVLFKIDIAGDDAYINADYNVYYRPTGTVIGNDAGTDKNWTAWQALGYDAHGLNADPAFVNIGGAGLTVGDYKITVSSPCKDVGDSTLGLTEDYWGTSIPQGVGFDIGAHEYQAAGPAEHLFRLAPGTRARIGAGTIVRIKN